MVVGLYGLFATRGTTARGITQVHFGFGVDGDAQRIFAFIRCLVDCVEMIENGIRFFDLFLWFSLLYTAQPVTQTIQNITDGFFTRQVLVFSAFVVH